MDLQRQTRLTWLALGAALIFVLAAFGAYPEVVGAAEIQLALSGNFGEQAVLPLCPKP